MFVISNIETKVYSGWILLSERIIVNYIVDFLTDLRYRTGLSIYHRSEFWNLYEGLLSKFCK